LLWDELEAQHLRLIATQVPCGVTGLCATCVDGVALNARNEFVVLEFKTGGETYLTKHTGLGMRAPFTDQCDAVLNQYFLQLGMGAMLYSQTFPMHDAQMAKPMLMQVTFRDCRTRELPEWVSTRLTEAVRVLYAKS